MALSLPPMLACRPWRGFGVENECIFAFSSRLRKAFCLWSLECLAFPSPHALARINGRARAVYLGGSGCGEVGRLVSFALPCVYVCCSWLHFAAAGGGGVAAVDS